MKSHSILRTNVGITTNVKLMVSGSYSLYLDSIESTSDLSNYRYKKLQFNKDNYWDELVPYFFRDTPADLAFQVKYDNDNDNMSTDFSKQYDDIYQHGARNIVNNKNYEEEYEYFAPLHITKGFLPTNFIIFRVDGPGLINVNKDNFRSEILNNLKCVSVFDLTRKTPLGEWLDTNITRNKSYPSSSFYMDFRKMEFSSWFGLDYEDGGYSEKAFMLDSTLEFENTYHDLEKFIFDGFKNNKVVYPHIINFSFLFDDTPATPSSIRRWSLNRYLGFYLDGLDLVKSVTPYTPFTNTVLPGLKADIVINQNNILYSLSGGNPFIGTFKDELYPYIEIGGNFYRVEEYIEVLNSKLTKVKISENTYSDILSQEKVSRYKIISNINLVGRESEINRNLILITSTNGLNKLTYYNGDTFEIEGFENADVWIIDINGKYHNIIKGDDNEFYIQSDYAFEQSANKFDYYINDPDPKYRTSIRLDVNYSKKPIFFNIYKCNFSDIKDFDTDIIETKYSKHEYIKKTELTITDEPKMYSTNYQSKSFPKDINDYKINGNVVNIPASSEYTTNGETFRIVDNNLSTIWRKNPIRLKWGLNWSISGSDYPYLLNNSFLSEDYNRTSDVHSSQPMRKDRNLDYFLTVNSASSDYLYHSLHVEDANLILVTASIPGEPSVLKSVINTSFNFELDKYLCLDSNVDYFSYFFEKKSIFDFGNEVVNTKKHSFFNPGDNILPNITIFRGIKFKIYDVSGVKITNGLIETINVKTSNKYYGYKFAILFSKNDYSIYPSSDDINIANVLATKNSLRWEIVDIWKHDKIYPTYSIVVYDDVLYTCMSQSQLINPLIYPYNSSDWQIYADSPTIFWSPTFSGTNPTGSNNMWNQGFLSEMPPLVYNHGEYYYSSATAGNNFWYPQYTYSQLDEVIYQNKIWQSMTSSNSATPGFDTSYWNEIFVNSTIWSLVELWRSDKDYSISSWPAYFGQGNYVVYDDVVWGSTQSTLNGVVPPNDSNWFRVYGLSTDTDYLYGPSFSSNNIFYMNNRYYKCINNVFGAASGVTYSNTLENGINIYINNKYKNILINIYVNDNTYDKIKNVDRDDLYSDIYSKLTANNLCNAINDLSNKYDFSDYIRYIVINEDSSINVYDMNDLNSVGKLPVILKCEDPDVFLSRIQSIDTIPVTLSSSEIKPKRKLDAGNIVSIDQINYYSDINLATIINRKRDDMKIIPNYSGLTNKIYNTLYRHSGPYSPIFNNIELFESPSLTQSIGNYKFDTSLTYFGKINERVIGKVNRSGNILKLRNNQNLKSIYPMLDEYGYTTTDFFIFKSTWDYQYHVECVESPQVSPVVANQSLAFTSINNNTNNSNLSQI